VRKAVTTGIMLALMFSAAAHASTISDYKCSWTGTGPTVTYKLTSACNGYGTITATGTELSASISFDLTPSYLVGIQATAQNDSTNALVFTAGQSGWADITYTETLSLSEVYMDEDARLRAGTITAQSEGSCFPTACGPWSESASWSTGMVQMVYGEVIPIDINVSADIGLYGNGPMIGTATMTADVQTFAAPLNEDWLRGAENETPNRHRNIFSGLLLWRGAGAGSCRAGGKGRAGADASRQPAMEYPGGDRAGAGSALPRNHGR